MFIQNSCIIEYININSTPLALAANINITDFLCNIFATLSCVLTKFDETSSMSKKGEQYISYVRIIIHINKTINVN